MLCYEFAMRGPDAKQTIGIINLRFSYSAKLRYVGHIGYEVEPEIPRAPLRRPQLSLAIAHSLKKVWLTVDPKDIPSQKICEILGVNNLQTVRIPPSHEMYRLGARYRRRYLVDLKKIS